MARTQLKHLLSDIQLCTMCALSLPHEPRPVVRASEASKILIIGQAPGRRVHESGIDWDDPSGVRLRRWLGVSSAQFYDDSLFAIMPMGFCYPGSGKRGDLPPRPECAPLWHQKILAGLPNIQLTLLIGQHAQAYYLSRQGKSIISLTERVRRWRDFWPKYLPLPHPSPRNRIWLKRNPWFEREVVPELRFAVHSIID